MHCYITTNVIAEGIKEAEIHSHKKDQYSLIRFLHQIKSNFMPQGSQGGFCCGVGKSRGWWGEEGERWLSRLAARGLGAGVGVVSCGIQLAQVDFLVLFLLCHCGCWWGLGGDD